MGRITVDGVGKAYTRYPGKWARLAEWVTGQPRHEKTWVLRDVSFRVEPGEAVGIVGVNGAGKSTLLKIITGTTEATTGCITLEGRVAALLELGMGFHPDFTGRQNALIAGQLLGFAAQEVEALMPQIEEYADIGDYFDRPLRIYSSGMQARVAFAAATMSRPDILIVDEALSVGDIAFQAKCMQRMHSLLEAGTTVLFVSHALNQVRQFCSKAVYLAGGRLAAFGPADQVCDQYQNDLVAPSIRETSVAVPGCFSAAPPPALAADPDLRRYSVDGAAGGSLALEFVAFEVFGPAGDPTSHCRPGDLLRMVATLRANRPVHAGAAVGLLVADKNGYPLLSCNSNLYGVVLPRLENGDMATVSWMFEWPFYLGEFRLDIGIKPDPFATEFFDRVFCARTLTTSPPVELARENFGGYLHVQADVAVCTIERQRVDNDL